jgi:hypothetical protein
MNETADSYQSQNAQVIASNGEKKKRRDDGRRPSARKSRGYSLNDMAGVNQPGHREQSRRDAPREISDRAVHEASGESYLQQH